MSCRTRPEEPPVQHMRNPSDRMPVAGTSGAECPHQVLPTQAALHVQIGGYVIRIVVIDEITRPQAQKSRESQNHQQQGEPSGRTPKWIVRSISLIRSWQRLTLHSPPLLRPPRKKEAGCDLKRRMAKDQELDLSGLYARRPAITLHHPITQNFIRVLNGCCIQQKLCLAGVLSDEFQSKMKILETGGA